LLAYIYIDPQGRDLGGYVAEAARTVSAQVKMPPGYHIEWSGQFEYLQRAAAKLKVVVMLSAPFALTGGTWLGWSMNDNMSVAVVVGFIALTGVAAETGVVMLIYLDHALSGIRQKGAAVSAALSRADLRRAIMEGAVERVRPKMTTAVAIMAGLVAILWSTGTGSEVMRRIAVPMAGGMVSSTILTQVVIPAIYAIVKGWQLPKETIAPVDVREHAVLPAECMSPAPIRAVRTRI
jgi:Cu(I)/Ag(I) efflux system membrane protein CusA/SilA